MRVVLLHAVKAKDLTKWRRFCKQADQSIEPRAGVQSLGENAWLLPADDPWLSEGEILRLARAYGVTCKTLEFDVESEWQDHPPRP
jgi:hypothetical protein